jgi:predicted PhzF superfamily epimerase YddE/YHI9
MQIGRPSRIFVEADVDRGAPTAVRVGGAAVMVCEGRLRL